MLNLASEINAITSTYTLKLDFCIYRFNKSAQKTEIRRENKALIRLSYIYYQIRFKKDINNTKALFKMGSEVEKMTLAHISKLDFCIRRFYIGRQKIDESTLIIFKIVMASFQIQDQQKKH